MKEKAIMPLYPHFFKYGGIIIALTGALLWIILDRNYQLLLYMGLIIMIFSKEKNDDERVVKIRSEVFKTIFGYYFSLLIALHFVELISEGFVLEMSPFLSMGFPLALYLLTFYLLLFFKFGKSESSGEVAEKRNNSFYIVSMIVLLIILTLIIIWVLMK